MIHIHPFPARMAPEIVINGLTDISSESRILDPMSGSGMVLGAAAKLGLRATGFDIDPLACLISKTTGTKLPEKQVLSASEKLIDASRKFFPPALPWMDAETKKFIDFWFAKKQQEQLHRLSHFLVVNPITHNQSVMNVLKVATSRLIISKNPKASLARDTAHSRPHRTIRENNFDVFESFSESVAHVLRALKPSTIQKSVEVHNGNAKRMQILADDSIDRIITSPPYLNAIDYLRGHRLSLVWLGYNISQLRAIRSSSVGSEATKKLCLKTTLQSLDEYLPRGLCEKNERLVARYFEDLLGITCEAFRVLKPGSVATYVIGNSQLEGFRIQNDKLLEAAAKQAGFSVLRQREREIPEHKRYLPLMNSNQSSLSKRMRSEYILDFQRN